MKKITLVFVLIFSFFVWSLVYAWDDFEKADYEQLIWQWLSPEEASKISGYTPPSTYWWWCNYSEWTTLTGFLKSCKPKTVVWANNMSVGGWFKAKINNWIKNISLVLWVLAVWSLVYAWLLMQFSAWEDEMIKKSKNIIKWTIIWFILLISASGIVYVVINVMFWLWS